MTASLNSNVGNGHIGDGNIGKGQKCLAISGGVGGAKLALGLSHILENDQLTIVANTGDDFHHLGFNISPDLDTVMYTLADVSNKELGWGQAGETWNFIDALKLLDGESWFQLGDRDLATHVVRSQILASGKTLSEATTKLCERLGVKHKLIPMTDDSVETIVITNKNEKLAFQHYFVRDRCVPVVTGFEFKGMDKARPSAGFISAMDDPQLTSIIICPSNPFVSVDPVLKLAGVMETINSRGIPVIAISPIVGGQAIKGPAAKMMAELGMPQTALAVAQHYSKQYPGQMQGFVLDLQDEALQKEVEALGFAALVTNTVMISLDDRINLAREVLDFANNISKAA
ncbi:MAG: 2-phospho-L-lactate transferase [Pseudomonadales bacterium]|jgi:LPPG:FO 2-phospho-L-lactate transferase